MPSQISLHEFCEGILGKDSSIRFAGLANKHGKLIEMAYRKGLEPLMNREETEHYTIQTVLRASTRETFQNRIGKQRYAIAVYEKLIRATIPITTDGDDDNKKEKVTQGQKREREEQNSRLYLLISFDLGSEVISIIEHRVLPQIAKNKRLLLR
jgi:hypothetical protein